MAKLNIHAFVAFLEECAARKDGYIMGTLGQDPKKLSSWYYDQYTGSQRTKALYWRENAKRVWDCQGLVEGYINDMTGSNINLRARNNYALWCDPKGVGTIPAKYRVPGAAVFIYSKSAGAITHVGYLVRPVKAGKPEGDWYVVEARGVMYGVVVTKLNSRGWNRWGLMTQYFDYDVAPPEGVKPVLRKGDKGAAVKELQRALMTWSGFALPKYGMDGDFGSETRDWVKKFQRDKKITVDGVVGPQTWSKLDAI